jgi:hypothetical protein
LESFLNADCSITPLDFSKNQRKIKCAPKIIISKPQNFTIELPQSVPGRAGPEVKKPSRFGVLHFSELQDA